MLLSFTYYNLVLLLDLICKLFNWTIVTTIWYHFTVNFTGHGQLKRSPAVSPDGPGHCYQDRGQGRTDQVLPYTLLVLPVLLQEGRNICLLFMLYHNFLFIPFSMLHTFVFCFSKKGHWGFKKVNRSEYFFVQMLPDPLNIFTFNIYIIKKSGEKAYRWILPVVKVSKRG